MSHAWELWHRVGRWQSHSLRYRDRAHATDSLDVSGSLCGAVPEDSFSLPEMFATADDYLEQGLRKSLHAPNWNTHVAPQFPTMMPWRTQLNESHVHDLGEMGSLLHEIFGYEVHAARTESDNQQRDRRLPSPSVSRVVFEAALAVGRRARQPSTPDIEGDQTLEHMVLNASQREELVNFFLEPSEASILDPHRVTMNDFSLVWHLSNASSFGPLSLSTHASALPPLPPRRGVFAQSHCTPNADRFNAAPDICTSSG